MYAGILCGKLLVEPVDDLLVEVVTSEVGVTVGGLDLEHAVAEFHYGDIEGTAAKVIDCDLHVLVLLVEAICERCRGRFVDDTLHVQTRNLAGFLGSLALGVAEVCRHRDHGLGNLLTEIVLSGLLHLLEYHSRNLLRAVETTVDVNPRSVVVTPYN